MIVMIFSFQIFSEVQPNMSTAPKLRCDTNKLFSYFARLPIKSMCVHHMTDLKNCDKNNHMIKVMLATRQRKTGKQGKSQTQ